MNRSRGDDVLVPDVVGLVVDDAQVVASAAEVVLAQADATVPRCRR
jgi:hypothetical protein